MIPGAKPFSSRLPILVQLRAQCSQLYPYMTEVLDCMPWIIHLFQHLLFNRDTKVHLGVIEKRSTAQAAG